MAPEYRIFYPAAAWQLRYRFKHQPGFAVRMAYALWWAKRYLENVLDPAVTSNRKFIALTSAI
jgi:hypothetical protein